MTYAPLTSANCGRHPLYLRDQYTSRRRPRSTPAVAANASGLDYKGTINTAVTVRATATFSSMNCPKILVSVATATAALVHRRRCRRLVTKHNENESRRDVIASSFNTLLRAHVTESAKMSSVVSKGYGAWRVEASRE